MSKYLLTAFAIALATSTAAFATDDEPKNAIQHFFDDEEDKRSDDEPETIIKQADRFWSDGEEEKAIDLYNQIIAKTSDEPKEKKHWAKAILRRSFLYASLDDLDKCMEGLSKLLDSEKSEKLFKKARKYSKLLATSGDKEVVKQLVFISTSNYLDKLLISLGDEEEEKIMTIGLAN